MRKSIFCFLGLLVLSISPVSAEDFVVLKRYANIQVTWKGSVPYPEKPPGDIISVGVGYCNDGARKYEQKYGLPFGSVVQYDYPLSPEHLNTRQRTQGKVYITEYLFTCNGYIRTK